MGSPSLRCYDDAGVEQELQAVPKVVHLVGSTRDGIQQRRLGVYEQQETARRVAAAVIAQSKKRSYGLTCGLIRPIFVKRGDSSTAMWHHAGRWTVGKSVDVGKDMGGVKALDGALSPDRRERVADFRREGRGGKAV